MKPIVKGMFARSLAGHDKGKLYVISECTGAIRIPGGRKNPYRQPAEKEEADSRTAGLRNDGCGS
mgnify:CR=1 FL=1